MYKIYFIVITLLVTVACSRYLAGVEHALTVAGVTDSTGFVNMCCPTA